VSLIWCPHVLLTVRDHSDLDFDVYSITQKYKKSEHFVLRWELRLNVCGEELRLEGSVGLLNNG
jgi:hypothetical protein